MFAVVLNIIKDPKVLGLIAVIGVLVYYQISIWTLENKVEKGIINIESLELKLQTARSNVEKVTAVNTRNKEEIEKYKKDSLTLGNSYDKIIKGKDKTIEMLKATIADLKKPVVYPETIVYKECKFEIKSKDSDEKDITFDNLLSIGR